MSVLVDTPPGSGDGSGNSPLSKVALLVEDNPIVALATERQLTELGASNVVIAHDIDEGLDAITAGVFEIVVLDVGLGRQTCAPIALACLERDIPIIFATGYGDLADLGDAFQNVPVVIKPYDLRRLRNAVQKALGDR